MNHARWISDSLLVAILSFAIAPTDAATDTREKGDVLNMLDSPLHVTAQLQRSPLWIAITSADKIERERIVTTYKELNEYNSDKLREGIKIYLERFSMELEPDENFNASAKVFALLRVLFDIPQGYFSDANNYGSWGSPVFDGRVNLLWPFATTAEGELILVGKGGRYKGPPYDGLAEFDELRARFPRRQFPTVKPGK